MNKICADCGNEFESSRPNKIYCSESCRRHTERSLAKQAKDYLEKASEAERRARQRRKEGKIDTSTNCKCLFCGKEFERASQKSVKPKYCNQTCRQKHRLEAQGNISTDKLCPTCNEPLSQAQVKGGVTYCSRDCYAATRRTLIGTLRNCVVCSKDFEPGHKNQRCCGDTCARLEGKRVKEGLENTSVVKTCVICNQDFHPYISQPNQVTCSKYCSRRRDSLNKVKSGYRKDINRRRSVIISATESEAFNKVDIFERDGWVCQVCGKKVDRELKYPNPKSASLDHILPMALGGGHTRANVQLAHLRCNIKKSDSGGAQLRLIGEA